MEGVEPIAVPVRASRAAELVESGYLTAQNMDEAIGKGASHCIVATDTGRHLQDGLDALDKGLTTLMEKPMATNAVDARTLISRSEQNGCRLFVACVLRFSDSLSAFKEGLAQIGELHSVRIESQSYLPEWRPARSYLESYAARPDEGGVLLDLIHEIDYAGWLFGWPQAVQARVRNLDRLGISADEIAELFWETTDGCQVSLCIDYLSSPPRRLARASGALGTVQWDGVLGTVSLAVRGSATVEESSSQSRDEMFSSQAAAFVESSADSHDPRMATAQDGVRALAVCDAAREASANHREVEVAYR
jgi:predicted dehydrogenase